MKNVIYKNCDSSFLKVIAYNLCDVLTAINYQISEKFLKFHSYFFLNDTHKKSPDNFYRFIYRRYYVTVYIVVH